ncbi:MAG TPA: branched-chain amino acid ABC transporter permease, partial [Chloroflexota bacterium]
MSSVVAAESPPARPSASGPAGRWQWALIAAVGLLLLVVPPFLDSYLVHLLIMVLFWAYLGACWNVLGGYAGLFSFGHALFFGIGGYTSTLLFMRIGLSPWLGMLVGAVFAAVVGLFIGYLSFRYGLRGIYFGLVTLAFAEVFRLVFLAWNFVGGSVGIYIPLRGDDVVALQFSQRINYYYLIFALVALVLVFTEWMRRRKLGYYLQAIREDEDAASALGINTFRYKQIAMGSSAFLTALGGTFYAQYFFYIDPNLLFGVDVTVELLLRPILGGAGTVLGPLLGSAVLGPIAEVSRTALASYQGVYLMVYGLILVVVMLFMPNGLLGLAV